MQGYVEIKSNNFILRGMLHKPENIKDKVPMVIFFHGFSATKSEHYFSYVEASRELEKLGIASARFDFMGSGESDGVFEDMSVETEINDGVVILKYVKGLTFVDPDRVALLGMSFGGLVAGIIAGRLPEEVKALCLWAPAAIAIKDAKENRAGLTDISSAFTTGVADVNGLRIGKRFVEDARKLDLQAEITPYKNNAIIIWGEKDPIVPPEIVQEYVNAYGDRLDKCMIKGVGHMFESLEARVKKLEATLDFLRKELKTDK